MSGSEKVPRLVLVASEAGKVTFRIDASAVPGATMEELLDARDWLIGLAETLRDRGMSRVLLKFEWRPGSSSQNSPSEARTSFARLTLSLPPSRSLASARPRAA